MERARGDGFDEHLRPWPTIVSRRTYLFGPRGLTVPRNRTKDILMNPELLIPPRPTISNIQWISGTQHVTPADMDLLSQPT